jgi:hypothetical protein
MVDTVADATGRKVIKVGLPREVAKGVLAHVPGAYKLLRIPPEAVDYYAHPTHYLSDHTQADLAGSGIHLPPFASYVERLVEFMQHHPEIGSAAMA